ncbi:alpha/beta hydrolase [Ulvibacter litoralis]|uniref:AB hydrolase-1 domain-containing protein n=1 Tax=Ulvibacter litoralis TaxID=227084 RepID=A0A1G7FAF7_9FLAO|nr:alpha/beta hydrolase [Ulvibacter litoralis]GHC52003.1 alpha/beta hydrolase [Ulvibacter litoralis]SDE72852.1 hypothetical protein SAMN05421855_102436 [Ulvibacter litoralis]
MRNIKKVSVFILSIVLLGTIGLYFMQERLIFLPTKLPQDYTYHFSEAFSEVFIETEDNARLNAIHFTVENPKGVLLYFHGNAGDLSRWGEITSYFTTLQYDVLVMDFRTYGKSTGALSEENLYRDSQLWYNWLLQTYAEDKITVYGRSLGTTFATYVASENNPKQLLLETPFYNLEEAARNRIPFLPLKYLLKYHFPSNEFMEAVSCPVTIFHGTSDSVVPFESGKKLSELIPEKRRTFITIPEGEHNNLKSFPAYIEAVSEALK